MLRDETLNEIKSQLPAILTINEIAEYLRVSPVTIRREIWNGALDAYKIGDCWQWQINRSDLITYLSKRSCL